MLKQPIPAVVAAAALFTVAPGAGASDNPPFAAGHGIHFRPTPTADAVPLVEGICFVSPSPVKEERDGTYEKPYALGEATERCGKLKTIFLREGRYTTRPFRLGAGREWTSTVFLTGHPTATSFATAEPPVVVVETSLAQEHEAGVTMQPGSTLRRVHVESTFPLMPAVQVKGGRGRKKAAGRVVLASCRVSSGGWAAPALSLRLGPGEVLGEVIVFDSVLHATHNPLPALDVRVEGPDASMAGLSVAGSTITSQAPQGKKAGNAVRVQVATGAALGAVDVLHSKIETAGEGDHPLFLGVMDGGTVARLELINSHFRALDSRNDGLVVLWGDDDARLADVRVTGNHFEYRSGGGPAIAVSGTTGLDAATLKRENIFQAVEDADAASLPKTEEVVP